MGGVDGYYMTPESVYFDYFQKKKRIYHVLVNVRCKYMKFIECVAVFLCKW